MSTIKLIEEPNEVYFKTTTNYKLEVDGRPLTICIEEDSNESTLHYIDEEGHTFTDPPNWILEMGENDWGELIFESTLYEAGISSLPVGEEIFTEDE